MSEDPLVKLRAGVDQARMMIVELVPLLADYDRALVEAGITDATRRALVVDYAHGMLFGGHPPRP